MEEWASLACHGRYLGAARRAASHCPAGLQHPPSPSVQRCTGQTASTTSVPARLYHSSATTRAPQSLTHGEPWRSPTLALPRWSRRPIHGSLSLCLPPPPRCRRHRPPAAASPSLLSLFIIPASTPPSLIVPSPRARAHTSVPSSFEAPSPSLRVSICSFNYAFSCFSPASSFPHANLYFLRDLLRPDKEPS